MIMKMYKAVVFWVTVYRYLMLFDCRTVDRTIYYTVSRKITQTLFEDNFRSCSKTTYVSEWNFTNCLVFESQCIGSIVGLFTTRCCGSSTAACLRTTATVTSLQYQKIASLSFSARFTRTSATTTLVLQPCLSEWSRMTNSLRSTVRHRARATWKRPDSMKPCSRQARTSNWRDSLSTRRSQTRSSVCEKLLLICGRTSTDDLE